MKVKKGSKVPVSDGESPTFMQGFSARRGKVRPCCATVTLTGSDIIVMCHHMRHSSPLANSKVKKLIELT